MNNRSIVRAVTIGVLVLAAAAAIAIGAYNAGIAHGIAESARVAAAPPAGTPVYPYPYMWGRPWGFGLFPIFPFFLLIFLFFVARGLFWRGPWRGGCGYYAHQPPPRPAADSPTQL